MGDCVQGFIKMKKLELNNGAVTLVDDEDFNFLKQWNWYLVKSKNNKIQYAIRRGLMFGKRKTVALHRLIMGLPKNKQIDHINGNGLDNQRKNLRLATHSENQRNKKGHNKTGYKGVEFVKRLGKWRSRIYVNKKNLHLGLFGSLEDAAGAYDQVAKKYFGKFAKLNFK